MVKCKRQISSATNALSRNWLSEQSTISLRPSPQFIGVPHVVCAHVRPACDRRLDSPGLRWSTRSTAAVVSFPGRWRESPTLRYTKRSQVNNETSFMSLGSSAWSAFGPHYAKTLLKLDDAFQIVNQAIEESSPFSDIHVAARHGVSASVIRNIISSGTNVDQRNPRKETALMIAARCGHVDLSQVAAMWRFRKRPRSNNATPLSLAVAAGHVEKFVKFCCRSVRSCLQRRGDRLAAARCSTDGARSCLQASD